MMHDFKYEHEEEHYGDEFESGKAHLHLAPTHKHRKTVREVISHPIEYTHTTEYDIGHRDLGAVHHDTFYHPTAVHEDHHEVLTPSGEEWVEVHRTPDHYMRHYEVPVEVPVLHEVYPSATHHKVAQSHQEPELREVDGRKVAYHKKPVVVEHPVTHEYHVTPVVHHEVPVVHHEETYIHEPTTVYESYHDTHAIPVVHQEPIVSAPVVKEVHEYDTHYAPHYESYVEA